MDLNKTNVSTPSLDSSNTDVKDGVVELQRDDDGENHEYRNVVVQMKPRVVDEEVEQQRFDDDSSMSLTVEQAAISLMIMSKGGANKLQRRSTPPELQSPVQQQSPPELELSLRSPPQSQLPPQSPPQLELSLQSRHQSPPQSQSPPPSQSLSPPPSQSLSPPPSQSLSPPPSQSLAPPPSQSLAPPPLQSLSPPSSQLLSPPQSQLPPQSPPQLELSLKSRQQSPPQSLSPPPSQSLSSPPLQSLSPPQSQSLSPPQSQLPPYPQLPSYPQLPPHLQLHMQTPAGLYLPLQTELQPQSRSQLRMPMPITVVNPHKCHYCEKAFSSYQALGGHTASHRKSEAACITKNSNVNTNDAALPSPTEGFLVPPKRTHTCDICFKTFLTGQALGGHKRRHYTGPFNGQKGEEGGKDGEGGEGGEIRSNQSGVSELSIGREERNPRKALIDLNKPPQRDPEDEKGSGSGSGVGGGGESDEAVSDMPAAKKRRLLIECDEKFVSQMNESVKVIGEYTLL